MTVYRPYLLPCKQLLQLIPLRLSVYDIGCGGGVLLSLIAHYRQPTKLGGFDIAPAPVAAAEQLVHRAAENGLAVDIRLMPPDAPLQLSGYEYITVVDVLHHLPPPILETWITQLFKAMDGGSRVLIKDIDGSSPWHLANKVHDLIVTRQLSHEPDLTHIEHLLKQAGFLIEQAGKERVLWYPHFWFVAYKPATPA